MRLSLPMLGLALASTTLAAGTAAAQDNKASLTLQLPVLGWSSTTVKPEEGDSVKTTAMETAGLADSYAALAWGKMIVYFYPFSEAKQVSASYLLANDTVEVGIDLGLNSSKQDKPKDETTSNTFGVFGFYYAKLGANVLEASLTIDQTTTKGEKEETTGTTTTNVKSDESEMLIKPMVNINIPLGKNVSYLGGLSYSMVKHKDNEADVKHDVSGLGINLATMRVTLD